MHCKSHQFRETPENTGYGLADKAVEKAAGGDILVVLPKKYWHLDKEAANYQAEDEKVASLLDPENSPEGRQITSSKCSPAPYEEDGRGTT